MTASTQAKAALGREHSSVCVCVCVTHTVSVWEDYNLGERQGGGGPALPCLALPACLSAWEQSYRQTTQRADEPYKPGGVGQELALVRQLRPNLHVCTRTRAH